MKKNYTIILLLLGISNLAFAGENEAWETYADSLRTYFYNNYQSMFQEAKGDLPYSYIRTVDPSDPDRLWDEDSWWSGVGIAQILMSQGSERETDHALNYLRGSALNFLKYQNRDGLIPFVLYPDAGSPREYDRFWIKTFGAIHESSYHKPVLAQNAALIVKMQDGDAEWLREKFYYLQNFVNSYYRFRRDPVTRLYLFGGDKGTGTDPTLYRRPARSTATPYLNALVYKELKAMVYLSEQLNQAELGELYSEWAEELLRAMRKYSWDPMTEYYYSVDLKLDPMISNENGAVEFRRYRYYEALPMRIRTWTGFCALWAEIATAEQAERMVQRHFHDKDNLNSEYGIRTLSKTEKMYKEDGYTSPLSWFGPVWVWTNYMTFQGLLKYGYEDEAREVAAETVILLGRDLEKTGTLHACYHPDNGTPQFGAGYINSNALVLNMLAWLEGRERAEEL